MGRHFKANWIGGGELVDANTGRVHRAVDGEYAGTFWTLLRLYPILVVNYCGGIVHDSRGFLLS